MWDGAQDNNYSAFNLYTSYSAVTSFLLLLRQKLFRQIQTWIKSRVSMNQQLSHFNICFSHLTCYYKTDIYSTNEIKTIQHNTILWTMCHDHRTVLTLDCWKGVFEQTLEHKLQINGQLTSNSPFMLSAACAQITLAVPDYKNLILQLSQWPSGTWCQITPSSIAIHGYKGTAKACDDS